MTRRGKASVLALILAGALGAVLLLRSGSSKQAALARRCDPSSCAPTQCKPGFRPKVATGACCPECAPAEPSSATERREPPVAKPCASERCAPCPAGMRAETIEGECCPRCVAADQKACDRGKDRYDDRYAQLETELRACSSNEDCTVASFSDACRASCPLPLNKQALGSVVAQLREAATLHCQACAPEHFECPRRATESARCVGGRCEWAVSP